MTELDTAPPRNTFRRFVWDTIANVVWARAFWGRRLVGGAIGLLADAFTDASHQSFYARLPGHPQQAQDSLAQVGADRDILRFRGESDAAYATRVREAWDDYDQGGTDIQVLKVVNQWGNAGWPVTWPSGTITIAESGLPHDFSFLLTIPYGMILPAWSINSYGSAGLTYGQVGLFYGVGQNIDLPTLLYLVRKWKRSTSKALVKIYTSASEFVIFTV